MTILRLLWDTLHDPRGPDAQRHLVFILDPDESAVNTVVYLFDLITVKVYHLLRILKQYLAQDTSLCI